MTIDELKQILEQRTGVPQHLLTGETVEENVAQCKALLAYKREHDQKRPKTAEEQFGAWLNGQLGREPQDPEGAALAQIEEAARVEAGGYPMTKDGGEVVNMPDARPAHEKFAEWLGQQMACDPFEDPDGWKTIL